MVKIPSVSWFVAYPHFVLMFEWTESETVAQGLVIYEQSFFILTECGACGVACCTDLEVASSAGQWSTGFRSTFLCGDSD